MGQELITGSGNEQTDAMCNKAIALVSGGDIAKSLERWIKQLPMLKSKIKASFNIIFGLAQIMDAANKLDES